MGQRLKVREFAKRHVLTRRAWVQRTLVTAMATGVAWEIGDLVFINGGLVAAIAASLSVRISLHKSVREGFGQILGTAVGAGTALLSTSVFGFGFITIVATVLLSAVMSRLLHLGAVASFNVPVTALIVIGPGLSETKAMHRMISTLIGVVIAIAFSYFSHPKTPAGRTIDQISRLGSKAAALLEVMAQGVAAGYTQAEAGNWLAKARLLVEEIPSVRSQALEARAYAKWFPTAEVDEAEELYSRGVAAEHTVVQVRAIARTLFDSAIDGNPLPGSSSKQISEALSSASFAITARLESLRGENIPQDKEVIADEIRLASNALVEDAFEQTGDQDQIARTISLKTNLDRIADSIDQSSPAIHHVESAKEPGEEGVLSISPLDEGRKLRQRVRDRLPQAIQKYF